MTCSVSRRTRGFSIIVTCLDCDGKPMDLSDAISIGITFKYGATVKSETANKLTDGSDGKVVFITPIGS